MAPAAATSESQEEEEEEAYIVLGRLNHVRQKHEAQAKELRDTLSNCLGAVYEGAKEQVERERRAILGQVELRYQRSLADLDQHRSALVEPVEACLSVLSGQIEAAERSSATIRSILANENAKKSAGGKLSDVSAVMLLGYEMKIYILPGNKAFFVPSCCLQAVIGAISVLAASSGLDSMQQYPSMPSHIDPNAIPASRLRGVKLSAEMGGPAGAPTGQQQCVCPLGCRCKGCQRRRRRKTQGKGPKEGLLRVCSCQAEPSYDALKLAYKILYREASKMNGRLKSSDAQKDELESRMRMSLAQSQRALQRERQESAKAREDVDALQRRISALHNESASTRKRMQDLEGNIASAKQIAEKFKEQAIVQRRQAVALLHRVRTLQHERTAMAASVLAQHPHSPPHTPRGFPPQEVGSRLRSARKTLGQLYEEKEDLKSHIDELSRRKSTAIRMRYKGKRSSDSYAPTDSLSTGCDSSSDSSSLSLASDDLI
jgi:hypothetical protein